MDDETFQTFYNELLETIAFTSERLDPVLSVDTTEEAAATLEDNCEILRESYKTILTIDVSELMEATKEAVTKVTERLIGCYGLLAHALRSRDGPSITRYAGQLEEINGDFIRDAKEATHAVIAGAYKIEV